MDMQESPHDPSAELAKRITDLLGGNLGASPFQFGIVGPLRTTLIPVGPLWIGLCVGLAYGLLFCALPSLFLLGKPEPHLFWSSVYGSLYAAWATAIARSTSAKVLETIKYRIIPLLSKEISDRIDKDLAHRFKRKRLLLVSWSVAILGAAAAGLAISWDVSHVPFQDVSNVPFQIAWWCVGWLYLFVTAARATDVARFYYVFAEHLDEEDQHLYVFDPARANLVKAIAAVGQHILLFWVGIAVSIALLVPFVSIGSNVGFGLHDYSNLFHARSAFAWVVVPITSVFSLPFGTVVFLRSENAIRKAVAEVVHNTLRSTEREIADLFAQRTELSESKWRQLHELVSLHRSLTTAGLYRSLLISLIRGLSPFVPLIGSIVTLLAKKESA
jgi:hypothetical protein